jgi:hypothetical protein
MTGQVQLLPFTSKKTCLELRRRHHRKPSTQDPTNTAAPNDRPQATADVFDDFLLLSAVIQDQFHIEALMKKIKIKSIGAVINFSFNGV